jgi:hypothetical protein
VTAGKKSIWNVEIQWKPRETLMLKLCDGRKLNVHFQTEIQPQSCSKITAVQQLERSICNHQKFYGDHAT